MPAQDLIKVGPQRVESLLGSTSETNTFTSPLFYGWTSEPTLVFPVSSGANSPGKDSHPFVSGTYHRFKNVYPFLFISLKSFWTRVAQEAYTTVKCLNFAHTCSKVSEFRQYVGVAV
jgi:hypothetical protein